LPGVWVHGDRAIRHLDGSWELPGRSDDLIKVAGKRVGPVEFESIATAVDGVEMAIAVGVPHELKGEVVVILVQGSRVADRDTLGLVAQSVSEQLGKPMRPYAVLAVDEVPLLRSGKLHRRAARAWLTGSDPGDLSSLANPSAREAVLAARTSLPE
jgi:acetyl-CoA synthetase